MGNAPKIPEKKYFSGKNSGILFIFHNPEIQGLKNRQSRDSGIEKMGRDPGTGIPRCSFIKQLDRSMHH